MSSHPTQQPPFAGLSPASAIPEPQPDQSIVDVLVHGQEPTEALLESLRDDHQLPPVSDEELEQQALRHPGEDGDPSTPE